MSDVTGRLVIVGTPIGNLGDMSARAIETLRAADVIVAEDTRHSRKLLTHFDIPVAGRLVAGHEHNEAERAEMVVAAIQAGQTVACITDAGMPAVSDPGARIVAACVDAGLTVEVVPGPSAVLAALVVSGLPTDRFVFEGFLPRKGAERRERIALIAQETRSVVCFEAPHRIASLVGDLAAACGPDRRIAIARELTKLHETVWRGSLGDAERAPDVTTPRGEYVVVIEPVPAQEVDVDDDAICAALRAAMAEGLSARDASARVAADLGIPKRRAYDLAVSLRR